MFVSNDVIGLRLGDLVVATQVGLILRVRLMLKSS